MSPATHFLFGWMIAEATALDRRGRALVAIAGIAPDFDAFGAAPEFLSGGRIPWFTQYHHIVGHNVVAAAVYTLLALAIARTKRGKVAALALLSYHVHLLCDIVGARGPDGYQWPIPYLLPFSKSWELAWSHQWLLNSWQNISITVTLLLVTFYLAWRRGYSPIDIVSPKADAAFIGVLRARFGQPHPA